MAFQRDKIAQGINITYKVGALNNAIMVTCPITGILGTLNMPSLPISFSFSHPLSSIANVRTLIKSCKDNDTELRHVLERQTLAGITLTLLSHNRLIAHEPTITATERNLFLQGCGSLLLDKSIKFLNYLSHTPFIEDHWKGYRRFPLFSFSWSQQASVNSFAESFLSYLKTLRTMTDPDAIEHNRVQDIKMDFIKEQRPKDIQNTYQDIQKRLRVISSLKQEKRSFRELKDQAKVIYEDLEPLLSKELKAMCNLVIRNLHLGIAEEHATLLSSKLFLLGNDDADKLAAIIKASVSNHLASSLSSFTQEVSPKPETTIAEILAAKKAKAESIVVEVMPRAEAAEANADDYLEADSEELVEEFDASNPEELEEDSTALFDKLNTARFFKGEI